MSVCFVGVQFHPESICTEYGDLIIENFRDITLEQLRPWRPYHPVGKALESLSRDVKPKGAEETVFITSIFPPSHISTSDIFKYLFGESNISFWLDSASTSRRGDDPPSLSFMGAIDNEDSKVIEYLGRNELYLRHYNGSVQRLNANIFEYLNDNIKAAIPPNIMLNLPEGSTTLPFQIADAWFGYIGYEARHDSEKILIAPTTLEGGYNYSATRNIANRNTDSSKQPIAVLMDPSLYLVYDHSKSLVYVVSKSRTPDAAKAVANLMIGKLLNLFHRDGSRSNKTVLPSTTLTSHKSENDYYDDIQKCLDEILKGETYEVCLTVKFKGIFTANPLNAYELLREKNSAPYAAYIRYNPAVLNTSSADPSLRWCNDGGLTIMSSSPERYLRVKSDGQIESKPIKGTALRQPSAIDVDTQIAWQLQSDEKSRAENLMIVDLVRNDFGRVCQVGTVQAPQMMQIETYASVHQLVSTIIGKLQQTRNAIDAIVATFPGGSMTGAPKIRTMEIIDAIEGEPRGIYSGTIGYIGRNSVTDLSIVIRTAVINGKEISINAGGAIVALSNPSSEVEEVLLKARAVAAAINCTTVFKRDFSSGLSLVRSKVQKNSTQVT